MAVRCKKMQTSEARLADRQPRLRAAQVVVLQIGRGGRGRGHSEQVGKINAGRAPARAADGGPPPPILTPKRAYLKSERFYFPTLGHRPVSENKLFVFGRQFITYMVNLSVVLSFLGFWLRLERMTAWCIGIMPRRAGRPR